MRNRRWPGFQCETEKHLNLRGPSNMTRRDIRYPKGFTGMTGRIPFPLFPLERTTIPNGRKPQNPSTLRNSRGGLRGFAKSLFFLCGLNPVALWFWKSSHRGKRVLRGEHGLHGARTDGENSRSSLRTGLPVNFRGARPVYGTRRFSLWPVRSVAQNTCKPQRSQRSRRKTVRTPIRARSDFAVPRKPGFRASHGCA
jgi:hypothetical protein